MKKFIFLMLTVLAFTACQSGSQADFSSPEATFQTMVRAIKAKDAELYGKCWHSQRMAESLLPVIPENPEVWDVLGEMVKGEVSLQADGEEEGKHGLAKKYKVLAPEVPAEKQLEGISLVKEGEDWKMYHW